ncbi:MAG: DUF3616 domain-containing protein [Methylobacter sp.]
MKPNHVVLLEFDSKLNFIDKDKKLIDGLSVVVQIGDTLWVSNDETLSLERLTLSAAGSIDEYVYGGGHTQFFLKDYLRLPVPPASDPEAMVEADLEGLAYNDGYLWLVGSHSLKRKKPKPGDEPEKARKQLTKVLGDGNRYLLARIPIEKSDGTYKLAKKAKKNGEKRTAAQLNGDEKGNELMEALGKDKHLEPFFAIPCKDNGFDIEGLAVANGHLFIGLRGPVLRGWAVILEVAPKEDKDDPTTLKLKPIGPDGLLYRKHFLQLGGLGVRELCVHGDNLLILAGPTMDLDGPVTVFLWPNGARSKEEAVVSANDLERLLDIPYGQGVDHAEGMALLTPADGGKPRSILVVYDVPSVNRQFGESTLAADVFRLPLAG